MLIYLRVTVFNSSTEFQSSDRAGGALYSVDGWGGLVWLVLALRLGRKPACMHLFGAHYVQAEYILI